MLKLASFAALAMALLSCGAQAQDLSAAAPGGVFAGPEVGAHIGAAIGGTGNVSPTGATIGAYAGYSLQNGPIVGGAEVDTQVGSVSGNGRGGTLNQNWLTSLRARGGYAFGNILAYGTIGPAWGTSTFSRNGYNADKTLNGYTFGAGGELAITRNISARAEIRHYEFNGATYYTPGGSQKISTGNNELLVGAGLHF